MPEITETSNLYELLVRWNSDGVLNGVAAYRVQRKFFDGEQISEKIGQAEPVYDIRKDAQFNAQLVTVLDEVLADALESIGLKDQEIAAKVQEIEALNAQLAAKDANIQDLLAQIAALQPQPEE